MTDTLDFVKNLWGSMSVPGMSIPGITAPTLSVEELDKKINDLKAVEAWLNLNMSMLRGSIQALEVQRGTIVTLKSMGAAFAAAVKQPGADEKSLAETVPFASAFFQQPAAAAPTPAAEAAPQTAAAAAAAPNPGAWWNLIQDQFKQAVSTAMTPEVGAGAGAAASEAAAKFVAAGKPAAAPQADSASVKAPAKRAPVRPKTTVRTGKA
ncbi:PhaM family polyhydroxyalkanoate granule multifunctional regulatory protein [Janthinobacterium sp.]|uniref:PhaM family polyhydroxyalkanoate granule multifunctional regulatory protein n=1 Tax=Janthinobacterium sp. TaxID=1871054 RepID=UPI00293D994D|nr:PhaM family polyhydroxyalkanoate granule multifunctional regulatory protein [Janthinobacterium sp.]